MAAKLSLGGTLALLREKKGLSPGALGRLIQRDVATIHSFETDQTRPSEKLLVKLGSLLEEDFVGQFPLSAIVPATALRQPGNHAERLRHLLNLVCEGKATRLAAKTGISGPTLSNALNRRADLSPASWELLFRALPTLNKTWAAQGKGQPFPTGEVPQLAAEARGAGRGPAPAARGAEKLEKSRPVTEKLLPQGLASPSEKLVQVYDGAAVTGGLSYEELHSPTMAAVLKLAGHLHTLAKRGCGMTPRQVEELSGFLTAVALEHKKT